MNWVQYYKESFLDIFNNVENNKNTNCNQDLLCKKYITLIKCSCELMKEYLNWQGLFQFDNRDVIKEAYQVELIQDGEKWINALSLTEAYQEGESYPFLTLVLEYLKDDNFVIVRNLNEAFKNIVRGYE